MSRARTIHSLSVITTIAAALCAAPVYAEIDTIVVTAQKREQDIQEVPVAVTALSSEDLQNRSATMVSDLAAATPGLIATGGPTGGNDGFYFIRGVGQGDFTAVQDPGVAAYLDGVYLGRTSGANFDMLDIERVEVLRGPQGTLFGRNAVGGAISVITADPSGDLGGKLFARAGSRDRIDAGGSLDFPIIEDTLNGLVSVMSLNQDGWGDRVVDDETMGDVETLAGRLKLHWIASENFDVMLAADATDNDGTSDPRFLVEANEAPNTQCAFVPGLSSPLCVANPDAGTGFSTGLFHGPLGVTFPNEAGIAANGGTPGTGINADRSSDFDTTFESVDPVFDMKTYGLSATIDWDLGALAIRSITAYREIDQTTTADFDSTRFTYYDQFQTTDQDQISQELQFSGQGLGERLDWIAGLYYFKENVEQNNGIALGSSTDRGDFASKVINNQSIDVDVETYAAFTQLTFDLTSTLALTGGLRYTYEEKETAYDFLIDNRSGNAVFISGGFLPPGVLIPAPSLNGNILSGTFVGAGFSGPPPPNSFPLFGSCPNPFLDPDGPGGPAPPVIFNCEPAGFTRTLPLTTLEDNWEPWTWRAALEWQASEDLLGYLSYSRGFKSGGFNSRPISPADIVPFDEETVDTWELGLKSEWLEQRMRLNAAVFYSDYQDKQILVASSQPGQFFVIQNAGDVDIYGLEMEIIAAPTDALQFDLGLAWTDAEYSRLSPEALASGITKDSNLPQLPDLTLSFGAQYTLPLGSWGDFTLRGDTYWQDDTDFGSANSPRAFQDSYNLVNVRGTFRTADERWSVSAYGRNITDEEYIKNAQDVFGSFGTAFASQGKPSEWGLEATLSF